MRPADAAPAPPAGSSGVRTVTPSGPAGSAPAATVEPRARTELRVPGGDRQGDGRVPSGSVPSRSVPSGSVPSGSVPSGDVPSGDVPSGDAPTGRQGAAEALQDDGASRAGTPPRRRPVVLVVAKGLAVGGTERVLLAQASAWDHDRYEYHLTYLVPRLDALVPDFEALGVEVHRPDGSSTARTVLGGGFGRLLRKLEPDVIHAHLPVPGVLARFLKRRRTVVVYSEHSMPSSHRGLTRVVNRATYGMNDLVVCVSVAVHDAVRRYPHRRLLTVPNAVARPEPSVPAAQVRRDLGVEAGEKLVVHVGNMRRVKGQETLVRAVAALQQRRHDFRVVSAGTEDEEGEEARLRRLVDETGTAERLRFVGYRSDVADLLAAADLVVNPSVSEGLPLALLEAMHLGRPIVATAVGGVPALLQDGKLGMLVAAGRPEELADGIARLLDDEALASRLGEAARREADANYSLEASVKTLEDSYETLIEAKRRR